MSYFINQLRPQMTKEHNMNDT